ncbi:MAG: type II toxin-antitoxin system HicB family antitoxin [Candidatus Electryonea clarkiae]|nr:type II toxin-antitoxin system HicB family antitoxin [Candidatus Electryonea clarkiae]MDP8288793.1 type II toxin-antitoxin system HicB family antitoxin [Candidatus Electryonea clarkiae]
MLTEYIQAAMQEAHYELMEDGNFFAAIEPLKGLWADGDTLEECRKNLRETLEDWLFISIRERMAIPEMGGIKVEANRELAKDTN